MAQSIHVALCLNMNGMVNEFYFLTLSIMFDWAEWLNINMSIHHTVWLNCSCIGLKPIYSSMVMHRHGEWLKLCCRNAASPWGLTRQSIKHMEIYWERVNQDTEIAKLVYNSLYKGRVRDSSELQSWRTIYYVSACIAMTPYYIKNMQYIETRVYRFIYCVSMVPPTYWLLVALVL